MYTEEIKGKLESVIGSYLKDRGLELVELIFRREGRDLVLRILVDRVQGGIALDECIQLNRQLGALFDEQGLLQDSYTLEVSSPGLDRPLKSKADFLRCLGREVRVFFTEPIEGKLELEAIISSADDEYVIFNADGKESRVPLSKVRKAKQIIT